MDSTPVLIALVAVALVGSLITLRLRSSARRSRPAGDAPASPDLDERLSTADQRFRMLSFQGGVVPSDLGPVLEELRRNGIQVDEATLRRKLAGGASTIAEVAGNSAPGPSAPGPSAPAPSARGAPATATVLDASDVPGSDRLPAGRVRVQVTLELRVGDRDPVREQRIALIPTDKRALLDRGAAVPVRYDPDHPRSLALEWEIS